MQSPIKQHPNALTSLGAGLGLGSIFVQVAAHFGLNLTSQEGLYVAAGFSTVALFIGRVGFVGLWRFLKFGADGK